MQVRKVNRVQRVHPKHLRERGTRTRYASPLKRRVQKRGRYECAPWDNCAVKGNA